MQEERDALQQMIDGYKLSQAIFVAAELDLADRLSKQVSHFEALAAITQTDPPSLLRLMRALASAGVLKDEARGNFALTGLGRLLRRGAEGSLHSWARFGASLYGPWSDLRDSVRTGKQVFQGDRWQHLSCCADESRTFNDAMAEGATRVARALLACCDLSRFGTFVDVGGGDGVLMQAILSAYPSARGVLFDLPQAIQQARARLDARCRLVEGSFFDAVPEGGDAYFLSRVLHDWNDERATAILRNARLVMAPGTSLFVVERVAEPNRQSLETALADLSMMVMNGGRERSRAEFEALLATAQFSVTRLTAMPIQYQLIEAEAV